MTAAVSTLCLPRISKGVPCIVTGESEGGSLVASLFAEREALGLPTIYPDSKVHRDIDEVVLKNLYELGYKPNGYSERYIKIQMSAICEPYEFEDGTELLSSYVVSPADCVINLHEPIMSLEQSSPGLGETVMYWIKAITDKQCIPGFVTGETLFEMFSCYRLEDAQTDEEAMELLLQNGYGKEDAETYLPSVIKASLGGEIFINPQQKIKARQLRKQLDQAGFKGAARLVQLLKKELPAKFAQARDALFKGPPHFWQAYSFDVLLVGGDQPMDAITEFIDQMDNDRSNNGESDDLLFVQRAELNTNPDGSLAEHHLDGLLVLANIFNAWTGIEEVISLLLDHVKDRKTH
ncbi:hypothetical protein Rfer_4408 (plasmid) [Rhodoferax ferrireducens T118]|uniref:Uncharacterized protein n=1 Tax=Albidiferax ferrireducens (strain ATCC BAA-621 / DSM 15236 / T118) TaxID=338969 RepID=Q21Q51_ALBFT|nr:PRTRC system protein F [Rhodoferax ferrireducens]ABD72094.1 hypothetical protein Rfer_4408 [Rhodoferax ferrireducens T118]